MLGRIAQVPVKVLPEAGQARPERLPLAQHVPVPEGGTLQNGVILSAVDSGYPGRRVVQEMTWANVRKLSDCQTLCQ